MTFTQMAHLSTFQFLLKTPRDDASGFALQGVPGDPIQACPLRGLFSALLRPQGARAQRPPLRRAHPGRRASPPPPSGAHPRAVWMRAAGSPLGRSCLTTAGRGGIQSPLPRGLHGSELWPRQVTGHRPRSREWQCPCAKGFAPAVHSAMSARLPTAHCPSRVPRGAVQTLGPLSHAQLPAQGRARSQTTPPSAPTARSFCAPPATRRTTLAKKEARM